MQDFVPFNQRDFGPNFDDFKITFGNNLEFIGDTLFDTRNYTTAVTTSLPFFSSTQTEDLTNLDLGNMIPDRQGFLVMSIRFSPKMLPLSVARSASATISPGVTNMMAQLINTGRLELNFLNKDYGTFPLWMLPAGGGVASNFALEGATADPGAFLDYANNGVPDARNIYVMEQPLFLPPMTKLGVVCKWPVPIIFTPPVTSLQLVLAFDGLMVRPVQ